MIKQREANSTASHPIGMRQPATTQPDTTKPITKQWRAAEETIQRHQSSQPKPKIHTTQDPMVLALRFLKYPSIPQE
jgi:hypothetical protein